MKSNQIRNIIFLLIILVAGYLVYTQKTKTVDKLEDHPLMKDRDFAYKNIDEINIIAIKRPNYPLIVLNRKGDDWVINQKFAANTPTVNHTLQVLKKMQMKYIPPASMKETIAADIKKNGIEVKLFTDSITLVKHYFVGTEFGDGSDTPVLMKGAEQAFMMYLPGLDGSIRRRLNFNMNDWRSKVIISENPDLIKKVMVVYPRDESSNFTAVRYNENFKLFDFQNKEIPNKTPNQNTIAAYLDFFKEIIGESNETENIERPRIVKGIPFAIIKITTDDNLEKEYKFFSLLDLTSEQQITSPKNMSIDNKYFGTTPDNNFILLQHKVVGKLFQPIWYFF